MYITFCSLHIDTIRICIDTPLKNHQLSISTHRHLRHLRDPQSVQRSGNTAGPSACCESRLHNSREQESSGPLPRSDPFSSAALTAESSNYQMAPQFCIDTLRKQSTHTEFLSPQHFIFYFAKHFDLDLFHHTSRGV